MNKLGQVFLWLTLVLLLVMFFMTTALVDFRTTWNDKILTAKAKAASAEKKLVETRREIDRIEKDINFQMTQWGRVWPSANSTPDASTPGAIELRVGNAAGLGLRQQALNKELPIVYVFTKGPGGASVYMGDFALDEVRADSAHGTLTRPPLPGEAEEWQPGEYRIREFVPSSWRVTFDDLRRMHIVAEQGIRTETEMLRIQGVHVANSQTTLERRLAELNGDTDPADPDDEDSKDGLVQTLRREETARNIVLGDVDQLRRELTDMYTQLTRTIEANRAAVKAMRQERSIPVNIEQLPVVRRDRRGVPQRTQAAKTPGLKKAAAATPQAVVK